jgi:uncharacterized membrane protein
MSSAPSMTGGVPSAPQEIQPPPPKRSFNLECLAAWVLPLAAICLLVVTLGMAVRSGETQWSTAGIAVYVVCLAMWVAVAALRRTSLAAPQVAKPTPSQGPLPPPPPEKRTFQTEFQRFAVFANSLFPWLAAAVLAGTSFVAAIMKQQMWLTTGIVSLCGWCLVWIGHLALPSLQRDDKAPSYSSYGSQQSVPIIDRLLYIGPT